MGHRLYEGLSKKCKIPHGHNEIIKVEIKSAINKTLNQQDNMILPFEKVKKKWHTFIDDHLDHAFQLSIKDPLLNYFKGKEKSLLNQIVVLPGDPTTEIMCACLMAKLDKFLSEVQEVKLYTYKITIEETPTNQVSLTGEKVYLEHLPFDPEQKWWWERADFSINNF